jgi:transposase-like protein
MLPIQQAESYESIETRIQADIEVLEQRGEDKPNLSAAAREFNLSPHRLRARWVRRSQHPGSDQGVTLVTLARVA